MNAREYARKRQKLRENDAAQLWIQAGGDPEYAAAMGKIAMRESGGNPRAYNGKAPDDSYGLWQINVIEGANTQFRDAAKSGKLWDPLANARAAVSIFNASKRAGNNPMRPWSTYNPATDIPGPAPGGRQNGNSGVPNVPKMKSPKGGGGGDLLAGILERRGRGGAITDALRASGGGGIPQVNGNISLPGGGGAGDGKPGSAPSPKGGYGGTEGAIKSLYSQYGKGLSITSAKRDNTNPYSGSGSDHDHGNKDAFAYDVSDGSQPTPGMDRYAYQVARALGIPYKKGQPINKTVVRKGIRYQLIYRGAGAAFGGNHMNHVHLGAKRVG